MKLLVIHVSTRLKTQQDGIFFARLQYFMISSRKCLKSKEKERFESTFQRFFSNTIPTLKAENENLFNGL